MTEIIAEKNLVDVHCDFLSEIIEEVGVMTILGRSASCHYHPRSHPASTGKNLLPVIYFFLGVYLFIYLSNSFQILKCSTKKIVQKVLCDLRGESEPTKHQGRNDNI